MLDRSRNGVDGRSLMPKVEVELRSGQTLSVGAREEFVIVFNQIKGTVSDSRDGTLVVPSRRASGLGENLETLMPVDDLQLPELLECQPDQGLVRLHKQRVVV